MHFRNAARSILTLLVRVLSVAILAGAQGMINSAGSEASSSKGYIAEYVSTAASGVAMNNAADVAGTSRPDPGCGWQCLPPLETVVWKGGVRVVLPTLPGLDGITVTSINAQGWVAGFAGYVYTTTHAVVWKPNGNGYDAIDCRDSGRLSYSVAVKQHLPACGTTRVWAAPECSFPVRPTNGLAQKPALSFAWGKSRC